MKLKIFGIFALLGLAIFWGCSPAPTTPTPAASGPAPLCASPSAQGKNTIGSSFGSTAGYFTSNPVTLASSETATAISVYVGSGPVTGQVRFGIYNDNAGAPGNLIIETVPQNLTASAWNTASLPNVYLPSTGAKVYWIAYLASDTFQESWQSGAGEYYKNIGWQVMPDTMAGGAAGPYVDSIYITTCP